MGDLNSRRGRIIGMEARGNAQVIRRQRAAGQMFGYATELRSMTQGRATYTMQFARYEEVPDAIAEEIMAKVAGKPRRSNRHPAENRRVVGGRRRWRRRSLSGRSRT